MYKKSTANKSMCGEGDGTQTAPTFIPRLKPYNLDLNWSSVTPLPIAAVDDTPPVTVFIKLSI